MRGVKGQMTLKEYSLKEVDVRLRLHDGGNALYSAEPMDSPEHAVNVMREFLSEMDREYLCIVNLDVRQRPINFNVVAIGSTTSCQVPIQNVMKAAILSNAAGIILMHNHPSGSVSPSFEDHDITQRIIAAGQVIGIPCVDHVIVAGNRVFSFCRETDLFDREYVVSARSIGNAAEAVPVKDRLAAMEMKKAERSSEKPDTLRREKRNRKVSER